MSTPDPTMSGDFLAAIGRLTISWATLELALDVAAHEIFHRFGGSSLERELPRALDRKIRFLKDSFRKLPSLAAECDRAIRLLDQVKAASDFRHDMIHGVTVGQMSDDPTKIPMLRLLREKTALHGRRFIVSAEMINQEALNAANLSVGAWIFAEALFSHT